MANYGASRLTQDTPEGASRAGLVAHYPATAELTPVVEERRPAPSPLLYERLHSRRRAVVGIAGQHLGGESGPRVLILGREDLGPVHAGCFQLPGPDVMSD